MEMLSLGERIALARRRRKLTQRQLAEQIGCQQSDIHRIEAGLVTDPRAGRIIALAKALQVSTDWLLGLKAGMDETA